MKLLRPIKLINNSDMSCQPSISEVFSTLFYDTEVFDVISILKKQFTKTLNTILLRVQGAGCIQETPREKNFGKEPA